VLSAFIGGDPNEAFTQILATIYVVVESRRERAVTVLLVRAGVRRRAAYARRQTRIMRTSLFS
jgi:hypothetical protein